jgi:hypothetical protein
MSVYSFDSFHEENLIGRSNPTRKSVKMIQDREVYNGVQWNLEACLGIYHVPIAKNLLFEGEDSLVYNAGRSIMKVNTADNRLTCIPREENVSVTCINLIQRKDYSIILVAGASSNACPVLYAFHSKKQTKFVHNHLGENAIISHAIMNQDVKKNSVVTTLGGNLISVWLFEKQKLMATGELKLFGCKIDMNSRNQSQLAMCAPHYLRFWEVNIQEKIVKEVPNPHTFNRVERENEFIDVSFIPNTNILVAISYPNTIFLIKDQQIKATIHHTFRQKNILSTALDQDVLEDNVDSDRSVIECMEVTSRGLYIGGEHGYVSIYSIENSLLNPIHIFTTKIPNISHVHSLTMSKDEQFLAAVVHSNINPENQPVPNHNLLTPSKLEFYLMNLNKLESEKVAGSTVQLFENSTHYGGITGISTALSRHFIATVGQDCFLKVWNLEEHKNCFLSSAMPSLPLCVAMHPIGFQVAVGFVDKVKFYYLTNQGLANSVEHLTKETRAVEYSRTGHYLAAGSGMSVLIINAYTLKYLYNLNVHLGIVKGINWTGRILTTCCSSGYIYSWNLLKNKEKILERQDRNVEYISSFYDESCDLLASVSQEGGFRIWSNKGNDLVFEAENWEVRCMLAILEARVVILGLRNGVIRQILWPFVGSEYVDLPVHMGEVNTLKYIETMKVVVTGGEDGAIGIVKVAEVQMGKFVEGDGRLGNKQKNKKSVLPFDTNTFKQFLLVHNSEIERSNQIKKSLKKRKRELKTSKKKEMEYKEAEFSLKLDQLQKSLQQALIQEHIKTEELMRQIEDQKVSREKYFSDLYEKQQSELVGLELKFNKLRRDEILKYERLKQDKAAMKVRCDKELSQILISHEHALKQMEHKYIEKMESVQQAYNTLLASMRKDAYKYEEVIARSELEYELEIEKMKEELEQELNSEKVKSKELQAKVSSQDEQRKKYEEEKMKEQQEVDSLETESQELQSCVDDLRNRLGKTDEQLKEREEVINRKESTIKELRAFNIHLMNFHFVLNQKIISLKDEGVPLDEKIRAREESIKDMYNEILLGFSDQRKVDENLEGLTNKLRSIEKISQIMQKDIYSNKKKLTLFQSDLANFIRNTDKKNLIPQLKDLCEKYDTEAQQDDIEVDFIDNGSDLRSTIEEANINQAQADAVLSHQTLMNKVNTMNKRIIRFNKEKSEEIFRKQHENAFLTKECNLLRNERDHLRKNVSMLLSELAQLKQKLGLSSTQPSINFSSSLSQLENSPGLHHSSSYLSKSPSMPLNRRSISNSQQLNSTLSVPKPSRPIKPSTSIKSSSIPTSSSASALIAEYARSPKLRKPRPY